MYACLGVDVGVLHLERYISIPAPSHNVSRELQCFNRSSNKTVFPWCILSTGDAGITVQQFYEDKIICKLQKQGVVNEVQLESAFLGKSKDSLYRIHLSLLLDSALRPIFAIPYL